jgi:transposase-like protein
MRHSASDKTELIRLVEQSSWPARRTLEKLGIPRSSFYRWYDRRQRGTALARHTPVCGGHLTGFSASCRRMRL